VTTTLHARSVRITALDRYGNPTGKTMVLGQKSPARLPALSTPCRHCGHGETTVRPPRRERRRSTGAS